MMDNEAEAVSSGMLFIDCKNIRESDLLGDDRAPFGATGASRYDDEATRMPRRYKRARTIQNKLVCKAIEAVDADQALVVDFGAGTANDGLDILVSAPRSFYVGIDRSVPMLAHALAKMDNRGFMRRSIFLRLDFHTLTVRDVHCALRTADVSGKIAVVMSALALHHSELPAKCSIYETIHRLLPDRGRFVLTDLFENGISDCSSHASDTELNDLRTMIRQYAAKESGPRLNTTISEEHYFHHNKPQSLAIELAALRTVGFSSVDVIYRDGQLAVLVAEKS